MSSSFQSAANTAEAIDQAIHHLFEHVFMVKIHLNVKWPLAVRPCKPLRLHAGAALSSGVGMSTLQMLAFLRGRASKHQQHQAVSSGTASPDDHEFESEGSNPVQRVYGGERQLPTCSFEVAQPIAP